MSVRCYRKQPSEYNPLELNSILERFYAELKEVMGMTPSRPQGACPRVKVRSPGNEDCEWLRTELFESNDV